MAVVVQEGWEYLSVSFDFLFVSPWKYTIYTKCLLFSLKWNFSTLILCIVFFSHRMLCHSVLFLYICKHDGVIWHMLIYKYYPVVNTARVSSLYDPVTETSFSRRTWMYWVKIWVTGCNKMKQQHLHIRVGSRSCGSLFYHSRYPHPKKDIMIVYIHWGEF